MTSIVILIHDISSMLVFRGWFNDRSYKLKKEQYHRWVILVLSSIISCSCSWSCRRAYRSYYSCSKWRFSYRFTRKLRLKLLPFRTPVLCADGVRLECLDYIISTSISMLTWETSSTVVLFVAVEGLPTVSFWELGPPSLLVAFSLQSSLVCQFCLQALCLQPFYLVILLLDSRFHVLQLPSQVVDVSE